RLLSIFKSSARLHAAAFLIRVRTSIRPRSPCHALTTAQLATSIAPATASVTPSAITKMAAIFITAPTVRDELVITEQMLASPGAQIQTTRESISATILNRNQRLG